MFYGEEHMLGIVILALFNVLRSSLARDRHDRRIRSRAGMFSKHPHRVRSTCRRQRTEFNACRSRGLVGTSPTNYEGMVGVRRLDKFSRRECYRPSMLLTVWVLRYILSTAMPVSNTFTVILQLQGDFQECAGLYISFHDII